MRKAVLFYYIPNVFPYHAHWKMEECHNAYWEFIPTVDRIYPVALGCADSEENWATTSMLHNFIKSNWTLEQLNQHLHMAGKLEDWDGLTDLFIKLVEADISLLEDAYIKNGTSFRIKVQKNDGVMALRYNGLCVFSSGKKSAIMV